MIWKTRPRSVKEDAVVGVGGAHVVDHVLFAGDHARDAAPAAPLGAVGVGRDALDVAALGQADDHVLVVDEILIGERLGLVGHDARAPRVAVLLLERLEVVLDEQEDLARVGEQVFR
ncbi:MAG: hypothetical protein U0822_28610 [Anaerolineae bacterium]